MTTASSFARKPAGKGMAPYTRWLGFATPVAIRRCRSFRSVPLDFPTRRSGRLNCSPPMTFTRKGKIRNWDYDPEFREGDFESLKDIAQGTGAVDDYQPSPAMLTLCKAFQFWIAFADIDGFRVDTVKHMDDGATRLFASSMHEFAQSLGKENFYLIGEITGGRQRAFNTLEITGLDAALGIDDVQEKIEYLLKGYRDPQAYFELFRNSVLVRKDSHAWFRNKVVTTFDDHDQVRKGRHEVALCQRRRSGATRQ